MLLKWCKGSLWRQGFLIITTAWVRSSLLSFARIIGWCSWRTKGVANNEFWGFIHHGHPTVLYRLFPHLMLLQGARERKERKRGGNFQSLDRIHVPFLGHGFHGPYRHQRENQGQENRRDDNEWYIRRGRADGITVMCDWYTSMGVESYSIY